MLRIVECCWSRERKRKRPLSGCGCEERDAVGMEKVRE